MTKQIYELSLWDTKKVEKKIAILASNDINTLASAYNINYITKVTGEKNLSFSMHYRYIDIDGIEKDNLYADYIVNGARIKLRNGEAYQPTGDTLIERAQSMEEEDIDERWIDFEITEVSRNSQQNELVVQAKELYVTELGRNGWSIVLDTELENNYGTASELGAAVLKGSNWSISEESYDPVERITEPLFITQLTEPITVSRAIWNGESDIIIPKGNYIYPFYSCVKLNDNGVWELNGDEIQFLWAGNNQHFTRDNLDDGLRIVDDDSVYNYIIDKNKLVSITPIIVTGQSEDIFGVHLTGYKIVKQQATHYCTENDKYVYDWNIIDTESAGAPENLDSAMSYIETSYSDVAQVSNLINNSTKFKSVTGWEGYYIQDDKETELNMEARVFPSVTYNPEEVIIENGSIKRTNYLKLNFSKSSAYYYNKGPFVNALELIKDDIYVIRTRLRWMSDGTTYDDILIKEANLPNLKFDLYDYKTKTSFASATLTCENIIPFNPGKNPDGGYPVPCGTDPTSRVEYSESLQNLNLTYHDEAGYYYVYFKANQSSNRIDNNLYLKITSLEAINDYKLYLEDMQLFKYIKAGISLDLAEKTTYETVVFPEDPVISIVKDNEIFFYIDDNDEIQLLSSDISCYKPIYPEGYASVRNLSVSKSNYFNNIQEIAELFQVWVKFKVYHDKNGNLLYNNDGLPRKEVIFSRYSPNGTVINYAGFKHGINEQSINRVMNSDQIATKVIVSDNNQEYATDGKCSITRAKSNVSGENIIYNFSYFIEKGLLDETELNRDLYGLQDNDIGLYSKMKLLNQQYNEVSKQKLDINSMYDELDAKLQLLDAEVQSLEKQMASQRDQLNQIIQELGDDVDKMNYYNNIVVTYNENVANYQATYPEYVQAKETFEYYEEQMKILDQQLQNINESKATITAEFYAKYYSFIREGTWTDDKYMDDELYYLDGLKIAETSAYPKVTYTINVADIYSAYEDYSEFKFDVGERTYVEDGEYFGYTALDYNGNTYVTPNKIEVIVSEYKRVLDNPSTSTITVQNYKNQFEELFQKITAQTQQLQYEAGSYQRAANAVLSDGSLNGPALSGGLSNPELSLGANDSFVWNTNTGIVMTNTLNTNEKIKLIGSGLYCSNDGGQTWATGITGNGVNAESVTAGILNVDKVTISSGPAQLFTWNKDGLHAYRLDVGDAYINYNQFGVYGTDHAQILEEELASVDTFKEKLDKIKTFSNFALTWDGLNINDSYGASGMQMEISPGIFSIKKGDRPEDMLFGIDAASGSVVFGTSSTAGGGLAIKQAQLGDNIFVKDRGLATSQNIDTASMFILNPGQDVEVECQDVGGQDENTFTVPACFHINSGFNVNENGKAYMYQPEITDGYINGELLPYPPEAGSTTATAVLGGNSTQQAFNYIYSQHGCTTVSTRKAKENIEPINNYDIDKMQPVRYNLIGDNIKQLGFIAEDMYEICPEAVGLNEKGEPATIAYQNIIPILVKEIQDLRRRVAELENNK